MISWILTYLMVGVALLFAYDKLVDWLEADLRLNTRERIIVGFLWPIALLMFIWSFVQVTRQK